jgi:hypothetical protein
MDIKQFQVIKKQLAEQAEANRITNENLANLLWMVGARESKTLYQYHRPRLPLHNP